MTRRKQGRSVLIHLLGLLALSVCFESLFLHHGLNALDEGWPLYASMQLKNGGVLYRDVFFVFPPGHLLSAWLAYSWNPPGVIGARILYAAFNVALCLAIYLLGRRLMAPAAALLAAALVAVTAPDSHLAHYLFGYRYLVFSVLALLCFAQRLRSDDRRWMLGAGALTGLALLFRLTPSLATVAGVAFGVLSANPTWRSRWRDGAHFTIGLAAIAVPAFGGIALITGWENLWTEVVLRPIAMTEAQALPVMPLVFPREWDRWLVRRSFVSVQIYLFAALYITYSLTLLLRWLRAIASRKAFDSPLLLAFMVWGGAYFLRAFGRADEAHLDSAAPAALVLIAHAISLPMRSALARNRLGRHFAAAALLVFFGLWLFITNVDRYLDPLARGTLPVRSLNETTAIRPVDRWRDFDRIVEGIRERTDSDDIVLDLTASSLLLVVSGRSGPGGADVIMPGTFRSTKEELRFVDRLEKRPPALVLLSVAPFDGMPSRAIDHWAPELLRWVLAHYTRNGSVGAVQLLVPKP